jgi:hypothetical protein
MINIIKDEIRGGRFKIFGTLGVRIHDKSFTRQETMIVDWINTVEGCVNWVKDNAPFCSLTIWDYLANRDITGDILTLCGGGGWYIQSRYN